MPEKNLLPLLSIVASTLLAIATVGIKPAVTLADQAVAEVAAKSTAEANSKQEKKTASEGNKGTQEEAAKEPKPQNSKKASSEKAKPEKSQSKKPAKEKPRKPTKSRYAQIVLSQTLPETPGQSGPFADLGTDLRKTLAKFKKAAEDDTIDGIVLDLQNPAIGRGKLNELRVAITKFRESGKKVHAQLEIATASDYLIASACDEISMPESGFLLLPGVRLEPTFFKGMLSNIGVKADFLHMGDAKGAGEQFTRKKWSKPVRENMESLAEDLYEYLIETIALDRPMTEDKVREMVDLALITASQAKEAGLIDRVAYPDEVRATLAKNSKADRLVYVQNYGRKDVDTDFSGPAGFFKLMQMMTGGQGTKGRRAGKKIAVVYANGPIMTGKSEQDPFGGEGTVGSTTIVEALREADDDDAVVAIVLRVDSPGGSAVASDLMWRKIQEIEKPVVASMGDVAASGGYYISMGCDKIFAEPGTITGSIGVVSGKFAMKGLYNKLGLTSDLVSYGENSGIFSSSRKWNESERAAMMRMMEDTYQQFTSKAAEGRDMPIEQLKKLAGGKVYTGRQAVGNGLVDELGTLDDAIAAAKKLAGVADDEKVRIQNLPEPQEFFEALFGDVGKQKEVRRSLGTLTLQSVGLPQEWTRAARQMAIWARLLEREPVGYLMPFDLVVE